MEEINGLSYEDFAICGGLMAKGVSLDEILEILKMEQPQYEEASKNWNAKVEAETDANTKVKYQEIVTTYFTNPFVGKFAELKEKYSISKETILQKVPDFDTYAKINGYGGAYMQIHSTMPTDINERFNLSDLEMIEVQNHYSNIMSLAGAYIIEMPGAQDEITKLNTDWLNRWHKELESQKEAGLADDIDF